MTDLSQLNFLIGEWQGEGDVMGSKSKLEHSFEHILQNNFILSKTRSTTYGKDGEIKEIHEDLGLFSYDRERNTIILREYYSEGYVNIYILEDQREDENQWVFTTKKTENAGGMRARLTIHKVSDSEFTEHLELAQREGEFKTCVRTRMKKN